MRTVPSSIELSIELRLTKTEIKWENRMEKSKEREALERLALNSDELAELNRRQSEINIFEILQVEKTEIRHSNILAWLLDPKESHGLGDSFLRGLIKQVIIGLNDRDYAEKEYCTIDSVENGGISNDVLNDLDWWIAADFYKVMVEREREHIDIIVTGKGRVSGEGDSGKDGFMIVIENKVGSKERSKKQKKQTELYYEKLMNPEVKRSDEKDYSEFKKRMFVFLSPDGVPAVDPHWAALTYEQIITALESAAAANEIPQNSALVIGDYIKSISKHITGDPELIDICDKLLDDDKDNALNIILEARKGKYEPETEEKRLIDAITNKYEKAIEAIESNHSDTSYLVGQYIRKALRKLSKDERYGIVIPEKFNQKKYIKFTTEKMTEMLGGPLDEPISPWRTKDKYYYEFDNCAEGKDKTNVRFYLILGGGEFLHRDEGVLLNLESQISALLGTNLKDDYTFKRCPILARKTNTKTFSLKNKKELESEVETFVCKMLDEVLKAEQKIEKMFEDTELSISED